MIGKALERGEKVDVLLDKTEQLEKQVCVVPPPSLSQPRISPNPILLVVPRRTAMTNSARCVLQALIFTKATKQLERKMYWQNKKFCMILWGVLIGVGLIVGLTVYYKIVK